MFILANLQIVSSYIPAFSITTYKAQALTINRLLVNLQASLGVLQVVSLYVPLGRVKKAGDLAILRPFDMKVLQIRPSPAQDEGSKRSDELNRKTEQERNHVNFLNRIHKQRVSCSVREIPSIRKHWASL